MKRVNFSCASPASAAVCTSIDRRSTLQPTTIHRRPRLPPPLRDHRPPRAKPAAAPSHDTARPARTKSHIVKTSREGSSSRYLLLNDDADSEGASRYQAAAVSKAASPSTAPREQVVHLRVSLHCKGCEGKLRKHISKMEGVRSFEIDLKRKKVTVVGEVTPLEVLSSISKVKAAQFWT